MKPTSYPSLLKSAFPATARKFIAVSVVTVFAAATGLGATLITLTGGDSNEGLDLTNGIAAVNFGTTTSLDVQGLTFVGQTNNSAPLDIGSGISVANNFGNQTPGSATSFTSTTTDDANLQSIVNNLFYDFGTPTITLSNLMIGTQYQFDLILSNGGFGDRSQTVSFNGAAAGTFALVGQAAYTLRETFTATSATSLIDFGGGVPVANGLAISVVPEPTTAAFSLLGLGLMIASRRSYKRRS